MNSDNIFKKLWLREKYVSKISPLLSGVYFHQAEKLKIQLNEALSDSWSHLFLC
jgi:hypothetical protein